VAVALALSWPIQNMIWRARAGPIGGITRPAWYLWQTLPSLRLGYWLWLASMILFLATTLASPRRQAKVVGAGPIGPDL
jgi:hypothetical protein